MQAIPSSHPPGLICMVSGEIFRYSLSAQCLVSLQAPAGTSLAWLMGVLVAHSLNNGFLTCLQNPALEWVWLAGDDHTFEPDILMRLLNRNVDIVLPLCLNRTPPFDPAIRIKGERLKYIEEMPASGLYKLADNETCGDAGMLIRRSALEKLGPPWYERTKSGSYTAEDQEFSDKIKRLGFDIWVDCDVHMGHISPVTFSPIQTDMGWQVRMAGPAKHIADLRPQRRD